MRLVGSHATLDNADKTGRSNNVFRESVGSGFFWPSDEGAPEPGTRVLQGELEVKKSLKLGFLFPRFSVRVSLFAALLPLASLHLWLPCATTTSVVSFPRILISLSVVQSCACNVADWAEEVTMVSHA